MLVEERRERIVLMLGGEENLTVNRLAEVLSVSRETIRRDLSVLERRGRLTKVHGGAVPPRTAFEASLDDRAMQHRAAKRALAERAALLFQPGESLLIDAGSTTALFAAALAGIPGLHVITNSLEVATALSKNGRSEVILLTGHFRPDRLETYGAPTIDQIRRFRVDHAVLTCGALDQDGIYDFDVQEAQIARAMIESARTLTVLADTSKIQRQGLVHICETAQVDRLVTDRPPPSELSRHLDASKVEVLLPEIFPLS
jgi:DeoR family transcriptional regulator, glycerol-3-phosphate regulon repressor